MTDSSIEYLAILNNLSKEKNTEELISKFTHYLNQQHAGFEFRYTVEKVNSWDIALSWDSDHFGYITFEQALPGEEYQLLQQLAALLGHFLLKIKEDGKKNEEKEHLLNREEKYQSFFSQISEGVYRLELHEPVDISLPLEEQLDLVYEHTFLAECNPTFVKMYGFENEKELIGTPLFDMHQPDIFPENRELLRDFITNNYLVKEKESREENRYGKKLYFLNNSIGIIKNGYLVRIWGTQSDITVLKESQLAHQQSEDRYRTLFNATFEAIVIHDKGIILAVNHAFEKLFKVSEKNITGTHGQNLIAHQESKLVNIFSQPIDEPFQLVLKRADGKKFVAEINGKNIFYQDKQVRMATIRDITEQNKASSKLQENEFRYRLLFESINDCAFVHGFNKQKLPSKYVEVNQAACELLGYSRDELLQLSPVATSHNVRESYMKKIGRELLKEGHVIFEMDVKTKSGKVLRMENSSHIFTYKNRRFSLTVARDITERKQSERLMKQKNEELIRANQELDNFVYRVSHDLRAPITSSMGLAELLQRETSLENVKTFSKLQAQSLKKLDNFINEILHYSRNSRLKIEPVEISALKLIESVVSPFIIMEEYKQVKFDYIIEGGSRFYTDKQRLEVVLNNLVSNAFKYRNPHHPRQFIRVSIYIKPKLVTIKVTDNGIGIKPEYHQQIFDMFFRATDNNSGSGLGLYIVKESLKKLKGRIDLKTEYGKGSEFIIDIPNLVPKEDVKEKTVK